MGLGGPSGPPWGRSRRLGSAGMSRTEPVPPDDAFLRALVARTERAVADAEPLESAFRGASEDVRDLVTAAAAELGDELVALSRDLHAHPEEAFGEHRSVRAVAELLGRHGVESAVGVGGLEPALVARAGGDGPHIAVLAEYDALPGIGHGCGHNIICSTGVGAFLAAARAVGRTGGRAALGGAPGGGGGGGEGGPGRGRGVGGGGPTSM